MGWEPGIGIEGDGQVKFDTGNKNEQKVRRSKVAVAEQVSEL